MLKVLVAAKHLSLNKIIPIEKLWILKFVFRQVRRPSTFNLSRMFALDPENLSCIDGTNDCKEMDWLFLSLSGQASWAKMMSSEANVIKQYRGKLPW